ncbi:hypothetical protein CEXT_266201 [Caerostris extrusa]|uniref:Exophilin 5 n=1 Tax=Caerostris extrusa TaxID=172846 RepID=A0AAV4PRS9_CAEEX|nr:hypothetical protein CEXT_266201 [Caerostris extrusa]
MSPTACNYLPKCRKAAVCPVESDLAMLKANRIDGEAYGDSHSSIMPLARSSYKYFLNRYKMTSTNKTTSTPQTDSPDNDSEVSNLADLNSDRQSSVISKSANVNFALEHNSISKHSFENILEPNLKAPICKYESESCLSIFDGGSTEIAPYTLVNSEETGDSGKQNRVKFPEKNESVFPEKEAVSEQYFTDYDDILKQNNNKEDDVNLKQSNNNEDDSAMNHCETENFTLNFSDFLNVNKIYQTNNSIHKAYEVKSEIEKSKLKETSSSLNCDTIYNMNPFSSFKGFSYKRSQTKNLNETEKSFTTTLENYNETQTKMESYKTENFTTFSALPNTTKSNETFCNFSNNNASTVKIESNSTDSCSAECRSLEDNAIEKQPKERFHNLVQEKNFSLFRCYI